MQVRGQKSSRISIFCEQGWKLRKSADGKGRKEVKQEARSASQVRNKEKGRIPLLYRQERKCRCNKDEQRRQKEKEEVIASLFLFFYFLILNAGGCENQLRFSE